MAKLTGEERAAAEAKLAELQAALAEADEQSDDNEGVGVQTEDGFFYFPSGSKAYAKLSKKLGVNFDADDDDDEENDKEEGAGEKATKQDAPEEPKRDKAPKSGHSFFR